MHNGSCLCGAIRFEVTAALGSADVCHCQQCRKWTGHFLPSVEVARGSLVIDGADQLSWYASSDKVRRGFCGQCGSSLFFDPLDQSKHDWVAIALGAFDTPLTQCVARHIFVSEKGDYYEIDDGLPQNAR
ncbi:GFA family protein [Ferrimonas pelagia]|uniref:GFA family protein n=1 Tax=Ferrimonas pelagia TaxID=1177826 RepID=A0ABP9FI22_9GAMM